MKKLKKIAASDLVKVFSFSAISTGVKMLTAFVSIKVLAVLVGPAGIAMLGQLNNFITIMLSVSTGGINNGVTKYTAEYADRPDSLRTYLHTSFHIIFALSAICGLTLIIGAGYWSQLILHTREYRDIFIIFGFTISFYSFNMYLLSILNGYKEFRKYITINIINSVVGLAFSIALVFALGLYGALLSAVLYQSVVFGVTWLKVMRLAWFRLGNFWGSFDRKAAGHLARYSLMTLIGAVTMPICQLVIRSFITNSISPEQAGLWEGMNRISTMYLMVITTSLSVYYLPRLAELKSDREIRHEIIKAYKIIVPVICVITLGIYIFRSLIVTILFDASFQPMQDLFLFQLLGDFFKVLSWILSYLFIAKAIIKSYAIVELSFSTLYILISVLLVKYFGTEGATIGYAVNYIWYFCVMLLIFRRLLFPGRKQDSQQQQV